MVSQSLGEQFMKTYFPQDVDVDDLIFSLQIYASIDAGLSVSDEACLIACAKLDNIINSLNDIKLKNRARVNKASSRIRCVEDDLYTLW